MTNTFFTKPSDLAAVTKARSVDINNLYTLINTAFDNVQAWKNSVPTVQQFFSGGANYLLDTSVTANAVTIAPAAGVTALVDGMQFRVKLAGALNGASTATVGTFGTLPLRRPDGSNPAGEYVAGQVVDLTYVSAGGGQLQLPQVVIPAAANGLPLSGGTVTGPINMAKGAGVASAAALDLQNATGNLVHITGTAAITSVNLAAGAARECIADGTFTLTHSTSLKLPGLANITATVGDRFKVAGDGSGNVIVTDYTKNDGTALVQPAAQLTGDILYSARVLAAPTYLKCDGKNYTKTTYPALSTLLGSLVDGLKTLTNMGQLVASTPFPQIAYGSAFTAFVAINPSYVAYANNPMSGWSTYNVNPTGSSSNTIYGLRFFNGYFIALGSTNYGYTNTPASNAAWTTVANPGGGISYDIAYGNSTYVLALNSGQIAYSNGGLSGPWTLVSIGGTQVMWVTYANSLFLAGNSLGEIYTSPDAATWTKRYTITSGSGSFSNGGSPAWNGSTFILPYNSSSVLKSADGITWSTMTPAPGSGNAWSYVETFGGAFVLTSSSNSSSGQGWGIAISMDGISWAQRILPGSNGWFRPALGNGYFAIGMNVSPYGVYAGSLYSYSTSTDFVVPEVQAPQGTFPYIKA